MMQNDERRIYHCGTVDMCLCDRESNIAAMCMPVRHKCVTGKTCEKD